MTSASWSDDDSDSNDAVMTSYRDVMSNRRGPQMRQTTSSDDRLSSLPVSANTSPSDLVETFDVYYVLPPPSGAKKVGHRGPPPPPPVSRWTERRDWNRHGEMTLTERRRPDVNTLLDAVPPTPGCCNDLRAATLPASLFSDWTSPPSSYVSIALLPQQTMHRKGKKMTTDPENVCRRFCAFSFPSAMLSFSYRWWSLGDRCGPTVCCSPRGVRCGNQYNFISFHHSTRG